MKFAAIIKNINIYTMDYINYRLVQGARLPLMIGLFLLLGLNGFANNATNACIDYRITLDPSTEVYTAAFRSTDSYSGALARITNSTQYTLVFTDPDGTGPNAVQLSNFTNLTSLNFGYSQLNSPAENPSKDYLIFAASNAGTYTPFNITAGTWIDVFSFKVQDSCVAEIYLFDNITDPLNSNQSLNPDNNFKVLGGGNTNLYCSNIGGTIQCGSNQLAEVQLKVMLQGALINTNNGLMRDDLRTNDHLPLNQPYSTALHSRFVHIGNGGTESTTNSVLQSNTGTGNAIVDWVFLEFRTGLASGTTVQTVSVLLQRDGDVVAASGGILEVDLPNGAYHVVVKHRNHLGVETLTPQNYQTGSPLIWDFTSMPASALYATTGYDTVQQVTIDYNGGTLQALWAGNCNADNRVKYDGFVNDRQRIAEEVIDVQTGIGISPPNLNFSNALGYFQGDVNMNGKVKYDGFGNDRQVIQTIVRAYPKNIAPLNNYGNMREQIAD